MYKKAKTNILIVLGIIAVLMLLFVYYGYGTGTKTLKEHAEPVDISKNEEGQGMEVNFYDKDGNPVTIPDWFKIASATGVIGAIVEHPPAPTCTETSDCEGYAGNPNILCWENSCVLANVVAMDVGVKVTNGASFDFNDVYISTASPVGFSDALPTGTANKKELLGGATVSWMSSVMNFETLGWIGTTQTFSVNIHGTNSYDGSGADSSDSISLKFSADPTGAFSVLIETAVPQ